MRFSVLLSLALGLLAPACGGDEDPVPSPPDAQLRIQCTGVPVACPELLERPVCEARGCTVLRACGRADDFHCWQPTDAETCRTVGCTWTTSCLGGGTCWVEDNAASCDARAECGWEDHCDGQSQPSREYCAGLTAEAACGASAAEACSWNYAGCSGTPAACEQVTDEAACAARIGCTWEP
jgi:hypothetical protein